MPKKEELMKFKIFRYIFLKDYISSDSSCLELMTVVIGKE